jgi:hypothetical protein
MAPRRQAFNDRFRRVAVVVRTVVGRMQVSRLADEEETSMRIFSDVGQARAWLAQR